VTRWREGGRVRESGAASGVWLSSALVCRRVCSNAPCVDTYSTRREVGVAPVVELARQLQLAAATRHEAQLGERGHQLRPRRLLYCMQIAQQLRESRVAERGGELVQPAQHLLLQHLHRSTHRDVKGKGCFSCSPFLTLTLTLTLTQAG
jgi:hypothetical protein